MNASGCDSTGTPYICTGATGNGAPLFSGTTPLLLTWQFSITGTPPSPGDTAHLKYHYVDTDGAKVGSLGSFDVDIQCIGGRCGGGLVTVPEPVSLVLVGAGLIGMYFIRRHRPGSR